MTNELTDDTLVYLCNPEWCDDGFHVEPPHTFDAFRFDGDVEEFSGESCYLFPISQGKLITGFKFEKCKTWWTTKPERMMVVEAKKRLETM